MHAAEAKTSTSGKMPPSITRALAYFHIPIPEYDAAFLSPSSTMGEKQETICSASVNSGLFTSLVEAGDVKATFVGHDHVNDYCGDLLGIQLCYGGGIGYHTYGCVFTAFIPSPHFCCPVLRFILKTEDSLEPYLRLNVLE